MSYGGKAETKSASLTPSGLSVRYVLDVSMRLGEVQFTHLLGTSQGN